jgi:Tol biopolymer transport system component
MPEPTSQIGRRVGAFTIRALLGAGGMGEVYRARDSRLDRDVAIKILPDIWLGDPDRRARFDREARLLASLNHPHIGAIYGVEDMTDGRALVLELVEGPTLADRLASGPLPLNEALVIAHQIAQALDAAHQAGIIHRDLKPANIKIRVDGQVKVLDFGLAKTTTDDLEPGLSVGATATIATRPGAVLGTATYMSPEQARGAAVDKRTDIWAFGCVLYEMLAGRAVFDRPTLSDTLAAILEHEPEWRSLPASTPPSIRRLVKRCLEKNVADRLRDIADARLDVDDSHAMDEGIANASALARATGTKRSWLALAAAAVISAALAGATVWMLKPAVPEIPQFARLAVGLPSGDELGSSQLPSVALSPDGQTIAYAASRGGRSPQLFVRNLDKEEATLLTGTDGAKEPFFSPDGRWIGFFAQSKLKKVLAAGGGVQTLADASSALGGTWSRDGTIYFAPFNMSAIWRVSADGGKPQELTRLDRARDEVSHRWPQILADGKTLLFTVWTGPGWDEKHLEVQVGDDGAHRRLVPGASTGRYISTGHLLYSKTDNLIVAPFDLARLSVTGPPVTLAERARDGVGEGAQYAVSDTGTLAYVQAQSGVFERRLVWVSRDGTLVQQIPAPLNAYTDPSISPDGRSVALSVQGTTQTLWIYDFVRSTLTTLAAPGSIQAPAWTPDGRRLVYRETRAGYRNLFWRSADGSGAEERLATSDRLQTPTSVSRDGRLLAFTEMAPDSGQDIWVKPLDGQQPAQAVVKTQFSESASHFSPDGQWLAYSSDESGRSEIYVSAFPGPGGRIAISTDGGTEPRWSTDGRELFYRAGDKMMAVAITPGSSPTAGSPKLLFEGRYQVTDTGSGGYDVSSDGRFLMIQATVAEQPATEFNIVLGWFDDVRARVRASAP